MYKGHFRFLNSTAIWIFSLVLDLLMIKLDFDGYSVAEHQSATEQAYNVENKVSE